MLIYLLYTGITILLALVDYTRIRQAAGKVQNINHKISGWLALITAAALILIYFHPLLQWHVLFFVAAVQGLRGMFYDISLNLFRGLPIAYKSPQTDAKTDNALERLPFWTQRGIFAAEVALILTIQYFVL